MPLRFYSFVVVFLATISSTIASTNPVQDCWSTDLLEPNDATPAVIGEGVYDGLRFRLGAVTGPIDSIDRYLVSVPPRRRVEFRFEWTEPFFSGADPAQTFEGRILPASGVSSSFSLPAREFESSTPARYGNATDAPVDVVLEIFSPLLSPTSTAHELRGLGCVEYRLEVSITRRPCDSLLDDAHEDTDDCTNPTILLPGLTDSLICFGPGRIAGADPDVYLVPSVSPGEVVLAYYFPLDDDLEAPFFSFSDPVGCSGPSLPSDFFIASAINDSTTTRDEYLVVECRSRTDFDRYSIQLLRRPDECGTLIPDTFEPNDACGVSATIGEGLFADLTLGPEGDLYSIQVPANSVLTARTFSDNELLFDPIVKLRAAPQCPVLTPNFTWNSDTLTTGGQPLQVHVRVGSSLGNCGTYDLELDINTLHGAPGYEDGYGANDTCAAAYRVEVDAPPYGWGFVAPTIPSFGVDYFSVIVTPSSRWLQVELDGDNLELFAYLGGNCTAPPFQGTAPGADPTWIESTICLPNRATVPLEYILQVQHTGGSGVSEDYSLLFTYLTFDPVTNHTEAAECTRFALDAANGVLQPNDDCATAISLAEGRFTGQAVLPGRPLFYELDVPAGRPLTLELDGGRLLYDGVPIAVRFHADPVDCSVGGASAGTFVVLPNAVSTAASYTNQTALLQRISVELGIADGYLACAEPEFTVDLESGNAFVVDCLAFPASSVACPCGSSSSPAASAGCTNSTGSGARLVATGSAQVSLDDLLPFVSGMPAHTPGILLASPSHQVQTTYSFYDGIVCLGNQPLLVERFFADSQGLWQGSSPLATSLSAVPLGGHRLQVWYRDSGGPCGTGSNTTNAIRIDWQ